MFVSEKLLHIAIIITVSLSGLLLGLGQGEMSTTAIAIGGALLAFLVTEVFKLFRFDQWFANIAAIVVTGYSLAGFGGGDRVFQLIIVANLLVYLQTILLFQKKTPRLYWQVLVLSLLQVVVAAVFNLGFEGGMLFVIYMLSAGGTTMLLHLYQDSWNIQQQNQEVRRKFASRNEVESKTQNIWHDPHPVVVFDQESKDQSVLRRQLKYFASFGIVTLAFSVVLFYFVPRDSDAWSGPRDISVSDTGASKFINLDFSGVIRLSNESVMRVAYKDPETNKNVQIGETPYLRGMPLSKLVYEQGTTAFRPPYTLVREDSYFPVSDLYAFAPGMRAKTLTQVITLEKTNDPLLYATSPFFRLEDTQKEVEFSTALDCLTRFRADKIENAPFQYKMGVTTLENGNTFCDFFPGGLYSGGQSDIFRLTQSSRIYQMLTEIETFRYPKLVQLAEELSGREFTDTPNHYDISKKMENYFLAPGNFQYTLDLGGFDRDPNLDPVEDFIANHRSGHCEYFASALTLMLRSQGIPARLVVGYRGGDLNEYGDYYQVQKKHAHAWVEVFIRRQDVPPHIASRSRIARRLGMWLRLDPTPPSDLDSNDFISNANDALGFAKSLWHDYVMGMTGGGSSNFDKDSWANSPLATIAKIFNLNWWGQQFQSFRSAFHNPSSWVYYLRFIVPLLLVLYGVWQWRKRRGMTVEERRKRASQSYMRSFLGRTLSLVSPKLGSWVSGQVPNQRIVVAFYERFASLLKKHNLRREQTQTQLEFASDVAASFDEPTKRDEVQKLVDLITGRFYRVRFGGKELNNEEIKQVDDALQRLEAAFNSHLKPATS